MSGRLRKTPHKCHGFGKHRALLKRDIDVFHGPNASIAPLLVATCNRAVVILNTENTEELADILL